MYFIFICKTYISKMIIPNIQILKIFKKIRKQSLYNKKIIVATHAITFYFPITIFFFLNINANKILSICT